MRRSGDEIHIEASARSFLHNQVRSMVGTLKLVGEGKWQPRDLAEALDARDRTPLRPGGAAGRALSGAGGLLKVDQFDGARIDRPPEENLADPGETVRRVGGEER